MTLGSQYGWALCRATVVAALAVLAGLRLSALLAGRGGRARRLLWAAVLLPFLTPALLVGYGWSNFSLSLVRHPAANELLYDALVLAKLTPVAAFVLYFAPAFFSPQAVHCRRLLRRRESGARALAGYLAFLARGPLRAGMVAFGLVFLLAFGEFEMASLMGVRTWTVGLFDANAGGLALSESLRLAALPAFTELVLLVLLLVALFRAQGTPQGGGARRRPGGAARVLTWCYVAAALLLVTLVPGAIVLRGTWEGLRALMERFEMGKDILASVLFGAGGAVCAYATAGWFVGRALGRVRLGVAFLLCLPGMLGALVLSLVTVWVFQRIGWRGAYDSPLPLVLALSALLFPLALLLRVLLHVFGGGRGLHAAGLMRRAASARVRAWGRRLVWQMRARPRFYVAFLLFFWGYFDLTASAILAPAAMRPVTVLLYNQMHYGQMARLSAMLCAAFAVPFIILLAVEGARGAASRMVANG